MYVSRLGMQLFRALRANVGITCVDVTLRIVTGRTRKKTKDEDCGQRARRLGPTFILYIMILYYSLCMHHVVSLAYTYPYGNSIILGYSEGSSAVRKRTIRNKFSIKYIATSRRTVHGSVTNVL